MHANVINCHFLRSSSTFLDTFKLVIVSFSQLVELLFYVMLLLQFPRKY